METRRAIRIFPAFDLTYEMKRIPAEAILQDFRIGKGHEGNAPENRRLESFHYEGRTYYNAVSYIVGATKAIGEAE